MLLFKFAIKQSTWHSSILLCQCQTSINIQTKTRRLFQTEVLVLKKEGTWVASILYNLSIWAMCHRTTISTTVKSPQVSATARFGITSTPPRCQVARRTKAKRKKGQKSVKFLASLKCLASLANQTFSQNNWCKLILSPPLLSHRKAWGPHIASFTI